MKKLPVTLRGIQKSLLKLMQIKWILLLMPDNTILSGDFSSIETDTALQESLIIKLNVTWEDTQIYNKNTNLILDLPKDTSTKLDTRREEMLPVHIHLDLKSVLITGRLADAKVQFIWEEL